MKVNRSNKSASVVRKKASGNRPIVHNRVIVVVDQNGNILNSRVVPYNGGNISQYYKMLSSVENQLASKYKKISIPHRVYSGTASSVWNFLTLFPEVKSPLSSPRP